MKKGYYQADTINGVSFYDTHMDIEEADILDPWPFYERLDSVEDPGRDDLKVLEKIKAEYGIH